MDMETHEPLEPSEDDLRVWLAAGMLAVIQGHHLLAFRDCNLLDLIKAYRPDGRPTESLQELRGSLVFHAIGITYDRPEYFPSIDAFYEDAEQNLKRVLGLPFAARLEECAFIIGKLMAQLGLRFPEPRDPIDAYSLLHWHQLQTERNNKVARSPAVHPGESWTQPCVEGAEGQMQHDLVTYHQILCNMAKEMECSEGFVFTVHPS